MKRLLRAAGTAALLAASLPASASADGNDVMVTIKPLHALVASIMQGTGTPALLIDGANSPHSMSLKPSQAKALQQAKVIFWVGEDLEAFLVDPLKSLGAGAKQVAFLDTPDLVKLPPRETGAFEAHDHGGEHEHEAKHENDHKHEHEAKHEEEEIDPHVWMDPENAKLFVTEAVSVLSEAFPKNAGAYKANADKLDKALDGLTAEITATLAPVHDQPFIVFHDAFQYMEKRFGLRVAGSITLNPEVMPGADRLSGIRAKVQSQNARCIFAEPQFEPRIVTVLIDGTAARSGVLDPLGAAIAKGPDQYFEMMRANARSLRDCLGHSS